MKKGWLWFLLIGAVFVGNILAILLTPVNFGFGNIQISLFGLLVALIGLAFWGLGFLTLGKSFSFYPKANELVNWGIYRYIRHPIYLGITLTFAGLSLAKGSLAGFLFTFFITTPLNIYRARAEENVLRKKFPKTYGT